MEPLTCSVCKRPMRNRAFGCRCEDCWVEKNAPPSSGSMYRVMPVETIGQYRGGAGVARMPVYRLPSNKTVRGN